MAEGGVRGREPGFPVEDRDRGGAPDRQDGAGGFMNYTDNGLAISALPVARILYRGSIGCNGEYAYTGCARNGVWGGSLINFIKAAEVVCNV